MQENLANMKKKLGADVIILLIVASGMFGLVVSTVISIIEYCNVEASSYEVQLVNEDECSYYALFVDDEEVMEVDYNEYCAVDMYGNTNVKMIHIINGIYRLLQYLMISGIFLLAYLVFVRVKNGDTPFQRESVKYLRIIAIMTMLLALIPGAVKILAQMIIFLNFEIMLLPLASSPINFYILVLGVVFGIISEIFKYGCELQQDMDQIA